MVQGAESHNTEQHAFVKKVHGIRYQVKDVARSVTFYTHHFGFTPEHQQLPVIASVSLGDVRILLSGPTLPDHSYERFAPTGFIK